MASEARSAPQATTGWPTKLEVQFRCEQFLFAEAEALDEWRLSDWLALLSPEIDYRIPVRNTLMHDQPGEQHSPVAFHMIDDLGSLTVRLKRLEGNAAWSERPHSRMRRHVSNVRVVPSDSSFQVSSNLLFFWGRDVEEVIVSCRRVDLLVEAQHGLLLVRRIVLLDHDLLPLPNLSLPL
jgi:3-phenylpropionate/cinnamic acid dioxygenase small subunit